ncbi:Protein AMEIOTIC 1 [Glycine max]|nr:Protein AMEIOTIC 1 [Glycine max]
MWEVLKGDGATFENPITRPALRMAARKHIGDTGLLDHLLKHIDGMHENMLILKTKVEQQLMEITNKLSDVRKLREDTTLSYPPVSWEDWLESTNIDNIQGKELAPWFGNPELLNVPQEVVLQDLNSSLPTQLHSVELTNMNR